MSREERNFEDTLKRSLSSPPPQMEAGLSRILTHLRSDPDDVVALPVEFDADTGVRWRWIQATAAILAVAAVGLAMLWQPTDSELYRVVDGTVHEGSTIWTNGGGGVLALTDGSRVELRSQSELSLERANDGLRILLKRGGIIVNAAKQRTGHLYVQTKDVTVSVVGTVFLVNAEEEGSRVAVIEGEVRVRQGVEEKKVRPGEQVTSSPRMAAPPVRQVIAWSRNAAELDAMLPQSNIAPPAVVQNSLAARETFEVASIRPTRFAPGGGRGGGGGGPRPDGEPCGSTGSSFLQFDPTRVAINDMTLYGLVAWAYELPCRPWVGSHLIVGGPGWVRSDGYDIEARFREGPLAYTSTQITQGGKTFTRQAMGPRFRVLLQNLLADRFGLVLRREKRDITVYALTVAPGGAKVTAWKEGDPATGTEYMAWHARNGTLLAEEQLTVTGLTAAQAAELYARNPGELEALTFRAYRNAGVRAIYTLADARVPVSSLAEMINRTFANENWRPVIDRTGITTPISYLVHYDRSPAPDAVGPSIFAALEKDLGLRLTPTTAPMEVVVIERVGRPTEN